MPLYNSVTFVLSSHTVKKTGINTLPFPFSESPTLMQHFEILVHIGSSWTLPSLLGR